MELSFFEAINGDCPYLEGREWVSHLFVAPNLEPEIYEALLNQGFRRSGIIFYQNKCHGCAECVPLRLDVERFEPSKSQRRVLRKNEDLTVIIEDARFDEESFQLYRNFAKSRYQSDCSEEDYSNFLVNSALQTKMMKYYEGKKLIGVGWLDMLADSISSVYFAFDPAQSHRSLGTYSVLKEVEYCKEQRQKYLHLGFWVEDCQAMSYKNRFRPYELLQEGEWKSSDEP